MSHRWTHPTPRVRRDGERIEQGEEFEPTAHELRTWPDRIEKLPTCAGADGECSRTVDEAGDTCWQHTPDEDTVASDEA